MVCSPRSSTFPSLFESMVCSFICHICLRGISSSSEIRLEEVLSALRAKKYYPALGQSPHLAGRWLTGGEVRVFSWCSANPSCNPSTRARGGGWGLLHAVEERIFGNVEPLSEPHSWRAMAPPFDPTHLRPLGVSLCCLLISGTTHLKLIRKRTSALSMTPGVTACPPAACNSVTNPGPPAKHSRASSLALVLRHSDLRWAGAPHPGASCESGAASVESQLTASMATCGLSRAGHQPSWRCLSLCV